ncbi:flavin reductase family protein [Hyphomicrobium sp.]|uniref:flavin reductase family protein n=1 Tax=Hyphomicrobium sp. TaxID=82 RepID=UPI000F979A7F|nr:flavin reductase family protein [Hyphomicrobium sp.]RUO97417.1 MAG: flavin reductase family protein [Hyphomicrobium sp.]
MEFDFEKLAADDRYKLLTSTIVPRPIAWITTLSKNGVRNAAPFSFFNAMSKDPALLAVGIMADGDNSMKDTARNILDTREFVVNLVPRPAAEAMNLTSIDAPPEIDELSLAKLDTRPSLKVRPERIAISPVSFECRLHTPIELSNQLIAIGEVVQAHVADEVMLDPAKLYVDTPKLDLISRLHGRGLYGAAETTFQMPRPQSYEEMKKEKARV